MCMLRWRTIASGSNIHSLSAAQLGPLLMWRALLIHYATDYISLIPFALNNPPLQCTRRFRVKSNADHCLIHQKGCSAYLIEFFSSFMLEIKSILFGIEFNLAGISVLRRFSRSARRKVTNAKEKLFRQTFLWVHKSIVHCYD